MDVQGLLASGHEMGMVGNCPYLDATSMHSARYMKRRGTGPCLLCRQWDITRLKRMWAEQGWMCREASIRVIVLRMLAPWGLGYARCFCVRDVCRMWEWIVDVLGM